MPDLQKITTNDKILEAKKYFILCTSGWREKFSPGWGKNYPFNMYPLSLNKTEFHLGNFVWQLKCPCKQNTNWIHSLNCLIQVVVATINIFLFFHSRIKQTLHCLLLGFLITLLLVLFLIKEEQFFLRDFPCIFVQGKCKWIGNKYFVFVTKQHFLFSANNLLLVLLIPLFMFLFLQWQNVDWEFFLHFLESFKLKSNHYIPSYRMYRKNKSKIKTL